MSTPVIVGLGIAAIGVVGRTLIKHAPAITKNVEQKIAAMPKIDLAATLNSLGDTKYYKGGFDTKMDKREAALILGVSPMAPKIKIKEAHKRIMLINHPDRGGSPYIASKINEAKDILDNPKKSFN